MTNTPNSEQPDNIDARLEVLGDEIDQLQTQMRAVREETRLNSQTVAQLQQTILELGNIARLHQQALRVLQQNAEADRAIMREMQIEMREMQTEVRGLQSENRRILDHLFGQQPG